MLNFYRPKTASFQETLKAAQWLVDDMEDAGKQTIMCINDVDYSVYFDDKSLDAETVMIHVYDDIGVRQSFYMSTNRNYAGEIKQNPHIDEVGDAIRTFVDDNEDILSCDIRVLVTSLDWMTHQQ